MLNEAKRVASTDLVVYNYLKRTNSITNAVDEAKKRKVIEDKMSLIGNLRKQSENKADKRWYNGMIALIVISILGFVALQYNEERMQYIKMLNGQKAFPLCAFHLSLRNRIRTMIINVSPLLYCRIIRRGSV